MCPCSPKCNFVINGLSPWFDRCKIDGLRDLDGTPIDLKVGAHTFFQHGLKQLVDDFFRMEELSWSIRHPLRGTIIKMPGSDWSS